MGLCAKQSSAECRREATADACRVPGPGAKALDSRLRNDGHWIPAFARMTGKSRVVIQTFPGVPGKSTIGDTAPDFLRYRRHGNAMNCAHCARRLSDPGGCHPATRGRSRIPRQWPPAPGGSRRRKARSRHRRNTPSSIGRDCCACPSFASHCGHESSFRRVRPSIADEIRSPRCSRSRSSAASLFNCCVRCRACTASEASSTTKWRRSPSATIRMSA